MECLVWWDWQRGTCAAPITADERAYLTHVKWLAPLPLYLYPYLSLVLFPRCLFGRWSISSRRCWNRSHYTPLLQTDWLISLLLLQQKVHFINFFSSGFLRALAAGKACTWDNSVCWYVTFLKSFSLNLRCKQLLLYIDISLCSSCNNGM